MKDLDRVSKLAERYTMETRIKAFHLMFFNKGLSDATSDRFVVDKKIIDSLKNSIAISFYAITSPVTKQSLQTDFVKLQNRLVSLINSFSKTSIRKNYPRDDSDIFLDSSFAVSNSNLEYISSWQWIEFFEFFDNTIASLFKVENSSNLVKYVIANELNPDIPHESFEHGVLSRMTDEEVKTLGENSWTLQELTEEMRKVDSVQDAYNVLRKKLLPMVFDRGQLLYTPRQHGSFQITMEHMFLTQQGKPQQRIQKEFANYVANVISKELARIDSDVRIFTHYRVEVNGDNPEQGPEQDLLVQSDGFNWIVEIKAAGIKLGLPNVSYAKKKLQTTYDTHALKASQQINRVTDAIQNGKKLYTGAGESKVYIDIPEPIKGMIGVTITLWNFSLLAHQQGLFSSQENDVYPIFTVFDFQYLLKSMSKTSDYADLMAYLQYRVANSEQIVAVDYDELNYYDVYKNDSGIKLPSGRIITGSKTPRVVSYVDQLVKEQLHEKIGPFIDHN